MSFNFYNEGNLLFSTSYLPSETELNKIRSDYPGVLISEGQAAVMPSKSKEDAKLSSMRLMDEDEKQSDETEVEEVKETPRNEKSFFKKG
jgi:hypothetical protein